MKEMFNELIENYSLILIAFFLILVIYMVIMILISNAYNARSDKGKMVDYLTKKYNMEGYINRFLDIYNKKKTYNIITLDIVNFKNVNNYLGYDKANEVLKIVANTIENNIKSKEIIARIERDIYLILLEGSREEVINKLINLETLINQELELKVNYLLISLRFGIYKYSENYLIEEAIDFSFQALSYAKRKESKLEFHNELLEKQSKLTSILDKTKEEDLKNQNIIGYLNPIVNLETGIIFGANLEVRWKTADGIIEYGLDELIEGFEQNSFIKEIDLEMLRQISQIQKSYQRREKNQIPIILKLSKLHFQNLDYLKKIEEILEDCNSTFIKLELEEKLILENTKEIIEGIKKLQELGIDLIINIKEGYKSLLLIKELEIKLVKIDIENKTILKNVITHCKELDLNVIIENIDSKESLNYIKELNSKGLGIGEAFSKALVPAKFELIDKLEIN